MHILFVTPGLLGHLFPIVPLAWAARATGHEVLILTGGEAAQAAAHAGLPTVDATGGVDQPGPPAGTRPGSPSPEARSGSLAPGARSGSLAPGTATGPGSSGAARGNPPGPPGGVAGHHGTPTEYATRMLASLGDSMATTSLAVARDWRPDCVVHTSFDGTGPLIAELLDIPAVQHTLGMGVQAPDMVRAVRRGMHSWAAHGVDVDNARTPVAVVDPGPPRVRLSGGGEALRYRLVPYNGSASLPPWLFEPVGLPRVAVTMGTVLPRVVGSAVFASVLQACAGLPIDCVFTHCMDADVGTPAGVRAVGWIPMSSLLPTCAAVVHHGGSGTTAAALAHGVPQLLLPRMADQFDVADAVRAGGVGRVIMPDEVSPDHVRDQVLALLAGGDVAARAQEVSRQNAELLDPVRLMERLVAMLT